MAEPSGRRTGPERGQSTVELALLLPFVVVLMLVVVQVGLVARDNLLVHHAAREGARRAAVEPDRAETVARDGAVAAAPALDAGRMTVSVSGGRSSGDRITVEVDYRARRLVPLVERTGVGLSARVTMRVERAAIG